MTASRLGVRDEEHRLITRGRLFSDNRLFQDTPEAEEYILLAPRLDGGLSSLPLPTLPLWHSCVSVGFRHEASAREQGRSQKRLGATCHSCPAASRLELKASCASLAGVAGVTV